MKRWLAVLLCVLAGMLVPNGPAHAHQSSDAYLQFEPAADGTQARVDVALRDLDQLLDLDADADGRLTWGEVRAAWPAIEGAVHAGLQVAGCEFVPRDRGLEQRSDGTYAVLWLHTACVLGSATRVRYTLLGAVDPTHRGLLRVIGPDGAAAVRVLDPTRPDTPAREAHASFVGEGVHHIVTGYDHLLFLLCLLLPAVMRRERGADGRLQWRPVARWSAALWPVLGIVTAFTVAHSITLALAATSLVTLPAAFIEPAIAATIVLAALDNLWPIFPGPRAGVTFLFGLVHGFGFAGVLGELQLPPLSFAWALLQFNLGLELGQVAIVLTVAALLYTLRDHRFYPRWAIGVGSTAALLLGAAWFVQRTTDLVLLPF